MFVMNKHDDLWIVFNPSTITHSGLMSVTVKEWKASYSCLTVDELLPAHFTLSHAGKALLEHLSDQEYAPACIANRSCSMDTVDSEFRSQALTRGAVQCKFCDMLELVQQSSLSS
jgi:hypothetical protein